MPAKGKHRHPKTQRFTRSIAVAVAGTGGAALALPLIGATGAHAATPQSVSEKTVQSAPVVEKKTAATNSGARFYTVQPGDYLSKIAVDHHVRGGWPQLYRDNRAAVGDDPSLIHPGLKLTFGRTVTTTSAPAAPAPSQSSAEQSAPAKATQSAQETQAPASSAPATASNVSAQNATTTPDTGTGYVLPVDSPAIGTAYHVAGSMWSSGYHTGVDFVVPTGTPLKAVGAGTVVSAGWGGAYGNQVVIKLADGYYAQYAHLSQLSVSAGQTVTAGQQVGLSGATGNVTGPHLHFEIRTTPDYGSDVDPVVYLRSHGVAV
ncbi:M23 family metallopeptidase [Streptomyces brasiliensis]|uniref:Peptidase n=1 Tax=Streptomyces brasiliensis TaxID=1954 RepID=A0A917LB27_9ACTN|nr:M23 family metallopeptidase [Streptomyces brasiliensis]GGJ55055.1 peptidase [Streptomyces brasiliensis]